MNRDIGKHPRLVADELIRAAEYATGAFGVADDALRSRIAAIVEWASEVDYSDDRMRGVRIQLQGLISRRLLMANDRRRFPGIAAEQIERPIFIIGYARTGTTLIQSLLASDPAHRPVRVWETREPSPPPGVTPVTAYRRERAALELDAFVAAAPGILALHPYWDQRDQALIEDEEAFTLDFQNVYCTLLYKLPSPRDLVAPRNPRSAYGFLREFLQHHQWKQAKPRHWVLKGTMHQQFLDSLFAVFPDAQCVWTHREPIEVHASNLAITAGCWDDMNDWKIDWQQFAQFYRDAVIADATATLASPFVDDPRVAHVKFPEFAADPIGVIAGLYERWGDPFSNEAQMAMRQWLDNPENGSDRYGRRSYPYEPFGVSADEFGAPYDAYRDRFLR